MLIRPPPFVLVAGSLGTTGSGSPQAFNAGNVDGKPGIRFTMPVAARITSVLWNVTSGASATWSAYIYSDDGAGPPSHPSSLLYTSTNTQSVLSTGDKTWTFSTPIIAAGTILWCVLEGVSANPTLNGVAATAGFASGRNATITSIASSGQAPATSTKDWYFDLNYEAVQ